LASIGFRRLVEASIGVSIEFPVDLWKPIEAIVGFVSGLSQVGLKCRLKLYPQSFAPEGLRRQLPIVAASDAPIGAENTPQRLVW